jgi:DNA-binding CsgD family transcriptional regulator
MHIANGKTREEIATILHRSPANVDYHLGRARRRCCANNLPHLVSIAIASGDLVWEDEQRTLNGHART